MNSKDVAALVDTHHAMCIIDETSLARFIMYHDCVYSRIGTWVEERVLSSHSRPATPTLIRECVRIVKKQCITSDNKQIEAGRGKKKLCIMRGFKPLEA